jgi:alpha-mannosidase
VDIRLEGDGLVFSSLKPAETRACMVLRCYNATSRASSGAWHFGYPVAGAYRARMDERQLHEIRLGEGGRFIPFHSAPHEIVTIMVALGHSD